MEQIDQADELLDKCRIWIANQSLSLQHPDLTPANVIVDRSSNLVLIDNELCCVGRTALLDVCNALHSLKPRARRRWLSAYWPDGAPASLRADLPALAAAWTVRRVGSLVTAGRLKEAQLWTEQHRSGDLKLPFDPAWL